MTATKKAKTNPNKITIEESLYRYQDNERNGELTGRGGIEINQPKKANADMEKGIAPVDLANAYRYRPRTLQSTCDRILTRPFVSRDHAALSPKRACTRCAFRTRCSSTK